MTLYIVGSPYQLINAIMIRRHCREDESVVYVMNFSSNAQIYYLAAKRSRVFDEVKLINVGYYETKNRVKYVANRLLRSFWPGKMIADENFYDTVFINGAEIYSKAVCNYFYKKNKSRINVCLLEDGIGTYERILKKDRSLRLSVTNFILGYDILEKCSAVYAYRPELISSDYEMHRKKIPCLKEDDNAILLHCFLEKKLGRIDERIIFLEGAFAQKEIEGMQNDVLQQLVDSNFSIALKSHPLHMGKSISEIHELNNEIPFELYCMNQSMDKKIMISFCSTAAFTPKLMFDQEPTIIFLYKMLPQFSGLISLFDQMIMKFEKICDRSKIYKPATKEELKKILLDL